MENFRATAVVSLQEGYPEEAHDGLISCLQACLLEDGLEQVATVTLLGPA